MSHFLGSSSCSRTKLLENSLVEYIPQIISYLARHLCQAFSSSSGILYLPVMIEYPGHRQLGLRKTRGESYNSTVDSDWPGLENHINPWNIFPIHNPRENPMVFGRKAGCLKEDSDDVCLQNSTDPYQRKIWAEPDPSTEQAEASPGTLGSLAVISIPQIPLDVMSNSHRSWALSRVSDVHDWSWILGIQELLHWRCHSLRTERGCYWRQSRSFQDRISFLRWHWRSQKNFSFFMKKKFLLKIPSSCLQKRVSHLLVSGSGSRSKLLENSLLETITENTFYLAIHITQASSSSLGIAFLDSSCASCDRKHFTWRATDEECMW